VAVVLAPSPDIFTFASIYIPLLSLYGAGLIMATLAGRPKKSSPDESTDEAESAADGIDQ
jgi:Sec-independent protein secretion pathway component TatC